VSESRKASQRRWREKNKEHLREYNKKYKAEHREQNRKHNRKAYKKHGHKYRLQMKLRRRKIKDGILSLLGNKCIKCGFDDRRVLQIDHKDGGGLKHMRTFSCELQYYIAVLNELKEGSQDYQLLCANCNWIKRYEEKEGPEKGEYI